MLLKKMVDLAKKHSLFLIFFSLIIFLVLMTYKSYGVTWDENFYLQSGRHYTIKILNTLKIPNNLAESEYSFDNAYVHHIQSHGVFFDVLVVLLTPFFPTFNYDIYHLIKALLALPSFIFIYLILLKLLSKRWALFGTILLWLFPRFYGSIFNNSIDTPTLIFFTLYLVVFLHFLDKKNSLVLLILLSFSLSIIINQRIIFFYVFLLTCLFLIKKPKLILFLSVFTLIFLHLTHPYLWQYPVFGLIDMLKASNNFPFLATVLFEGKFIQASQLPWYYIPKSMLITIPLSVLGLFIAGNYHLLMVAFNKKAPFKLKSISIYLLALFYIPLMAVFILHPVLYDSWRHFLFLTIPLIIIAVYGAYAISKIKNNLIKIILFGLIAVNLLQTAYEMKTLHPYQYIYFNSLVGGLKGAYRKYETDYYGASYKEAVEWFNKNINKPDKIYYIAAQGDPSSSVYYFKKNMIFTIDYNLVNYIISFTRWNFDQQYTGKIVHIVEREGVPLNFIKKFP